MPTKVKAPGALSQSAPLGRIEVRPRVIGSIVGHTATECYGIVGMAARGLRDGIAERLNRESLHRGVDIRVIEGGVEIELYVIAQYGTRISEVAHNLMSAVKYSVESTLGLPVLAVNVNVQGIHLEEGSRAGR
ncbi:MAG: Asp23/Gls24 family envelope stress response protein [Candidatus Dormibacteria bacterium]